MSSKLKGNLAEKVGEIKRMQANWMRERSLRGDEGGSGTADERYSPPAHRKSRDKRTTKSAQPNNKGSDSISWAFSSGAKKKAAPATSVAKSSGREKTLWTRSASPARGTQHVSARNDQPATSSRKSTSRPSSARSNASDGSRPPSGRNAPPASHSGKSSRGLGHQHGVHDGLGKESTRPYADGNNGRLGHMPSRFSSEPNLSEIPGCGEGSSRREDAPSGNSDADRGRFTQPSHPQQVHQPHEQDSDHRRSSQLPEGRTSPNRSGMGAGPKSVLDPDAFDRLADQIASRVKAEMKEEKQELIINRSGFTSKSILLDGNDDDNSGRIGHHCLKCKQLMVPPDHTPTILIPCGHTFCEACSDDRIKCPTCRTRVTSTSVNSALQDVIMASSKSIQDQDAPCISNLSQDHPPNHTTSHANQNHTPNFPTDPHGTNHRTTEYMPARYSNRGQVHSGHGDDNGHYAHGHEDTRVDDDKARTREISDSERGGGKRDGAPKRRISPEEEARRLEEEYQSLGIRCEALESEETDVLERIEKQNQDISQHKQQMGKITGKQQQLREEIKSLEGRLADLEGHRQEYKRQVEDAEDRKQEDLDQLAMVRTMLRDMQRNRERVKMSARKLDLSLE